MAQLTKNNSCRQFFNLLMNSNSKKLEHLSSRSAKKQSIFEFEFKYEFATLLANHYNCSVLNYKFPYFSRFCDYKQHINICRVRIHKFKYCYKDYSKIFKRKLFIQLHTFVDSSTVKKNRP